MSSARLIIFYICADFHENILKTSELWSRHDFTMKFTTGHNSINNEGGVAKFVFCISSDHYRPSCDPKASTKQGHIPAGSRRRSENIHLGIIEIIHLEISEASVR